MLMQWNKIGHIFDPSDYKLSPGCISHARSPQGIELDDRVRIYFCSQTKIINGTCESIPQYCDFTKDLKSVIEVSKSPIINLGNTGDFDEHGIFPFGITVVEDKIYAFTTGWSRRLSVPFDMSIGLAISNNDKTFFKKIGKGGPLLTAKLNEACLIGDAHVRKFGDIWHMWYIFSKGWLLQEKGNFLPERHYQITHATSKDLINWNRLSEFSIPNAIDNECQALPTVFKYKDIYHMIFCFRSSFNFRKEKSLSYRLGYAYSYDLDHWNRDDSLLAITRPAQGWDSEMMCYPSVFFINNKLHLLYNGNQFGKGGFGAFVLEND